MDLRNSGQPPERWHLVRKIVLLLLLAVALALGLVILSRRGTALPPVMFNVFADAGMGVLVGLGTRMVLRRRNWFIQTVTSAALSIVGLTLLGYFTDWKSGIGPLQAGMVRLHWLDWANLALRLPLQFGKSRMDLLDLAHMAIAVDTSWIALRAWKRSPRVVGQPVEAAPRAAPRAVAAAVQPVAMPSAASAGRARVPSRTSAISRPKVSRRGLGRPLISRGKAPLQVGRARAKRWNPLRRRSAVQLATYEAHRCPYCLEDVNRNDPRGTVECPVCHTLHHKDCWDITGTCQVPHLNN